MIDSELKESIQNAIGWMQEALRLLAEQRESTQPSPKQESSPSNSGIGGRSDVRIAWGAKVSPQFKERVIWIAENLGTNPDYLMACMAWESGETFRADIKNGAGSGATGLIQFMPNTAKGLGTTTQALAAMTPEDQLKYVYEYFKPYAGRLANLGDVYMAILWPSGVSKPDSYVLFDKQRTPTTFRQNAGLDNNKDGKVTRAECLVKIMEKLAKGVQLAG